MDKIVIGDVEYRKVGDKVKVITTVRPGLTTAGLYPYKDIDSTIAKRLGFIKASKKKVDEEEEE